MSYYDILEVSPKASNEVIKMAYKALVKKYHPDVSADDIEKATQKMKELNEAYDVLSDIEKRKRYDQLIFQRDFVKSNDNSYPRAASDNSYPRNSSNANYAQYNANNSQGQPESAQSKSNEGSKNKSEDGVKRASHVASANETTSNTSKQATPNRPAAADGVIKPNQSSEPKSKIALFTILFLCLVAISIGIFLLRGYEKPAETVPTQSTKLSVITIKESQTFQTTVSAPVAVSTTTAVIASSMTTAMAEATTSATANAATTATTSAVIASTSATTSTTKQIVPATFGLNATQSDVKTIMGTPSKIENWQGRKEIWWTYGNSIVKFSYSNVVIGWDVNSTKLACFLGNAKANAYFTISSSSQEVIDAMGTPNEIEHWQGFEEIWWTYGNSIVKFSNQYKVVGWEENSTDLRAK